MKKSKALETENNKEEDLKSSNNRKNLLNISPKKIIPSYNKKKKNEVDASNIEFHTD